MLCAHHQDDHFYQANCQILLKEGCDDPIVIQDVTQLVLEESIITEVIEKFRYFYSTKLFDQAHLWKIAFPQKQEELRKATSYSHTPQLAKSSARLDQKRTDKVIKQLGMLELSQIDQNENKSQFTDNIKDTVDLLTKKQETMTTPTKQFFDPVSINDQFELSHNGKEPPEIIVQ